MPTKSPSAVAVFLFLALILTFIPTAILVILLLQRRQSQRLRSEQSKAEARFAQDSPSIELGNFQAPPPPPQVPAATIAPIRSMSARSTVGQAMPPSLQTRRNSTSRYTGLSAGPGPAIESTAQEPAYTNAYSPNYVYPYPEPRTLTSNPHAQVVSPMSPRYDLQTALDGEPSPVSLRVAGERKLSLSDAPRVKSQKVNRQDIIEESVYPRAPAVPSTRFEHGYFQDSNPHQRWI